MRHPSATPAHAAAPRAARRSRRARGARAGPARPSPRHSALTDHAAIGRNVNRTVCQSAQERFLNRVISALGFLFIGTVSV